MPLAEQVHHLAQEIITSYETRTANLTQVRKATRTQLQNMASTRHRSARQMRAGLAEGQANLTRYEKQRKSQTGAWIKQVASANQNAAQRLHSDLSQGEARRQVEARARQTLLASAQREAARRLHSHLAQSETQRKMQATASLQTLISNHAQAQTAWRNLVSTMQTKRASTTPATKAPTPVSAQEPPAARRAAEATPSAASQTPREGLEPAELRDHVFEYLANRPDGTRLVELEQQFKVSRIEMARLVNELMGEGKVEKRDLSYFAV